MSAIVLVDGSILMNTPFKNARFLIDAEDKGAMLVGCTFHDCIFEWAHPDTDESFAYRCIFEDCQGLGMLPNRKGFNIMWRCSD